jgi:hypothetical protein
MSRYSFNISISERIDIFLFIIFHFILMPICPFCSKEMHLQDFYEVYEKKKRGKIKTRRESFKREVFKVMVG